MNKKQKKLIINDEKLYFILFVIHAIAEKYNISPKKVYKTMTNSDVIDNYIVGCYDVVHSMGKIAIIDDVEEYLASRGIKICQYDIIEGPVANDKVYAVVDMYRNGLWDKKKTLKELKYYRVSNQISFVRQSAIDKYLGYVDCEVIKNGK